MKKVKIMLMSALVVAAVGGALAFKAQKNTGLFCGPATNSCTVIDDVDRYTTLGADIDNKVDNLFCSTQATTIGCTYVTFED